MSAAVAAVHSSSSWATPGAIAGVVIGSVVGLALVVALCCYLPRLQGGDHEGTDTSLPSLRVAPAVAQLPSAST